MTVTVEGIGLFLGLILTSSAVVGLATRWVLLPFLRSELIGPLQRETIDPLKADMTTLVGDMKRVKAQVENSHTTNLRDDLSKAIRLLEGQNAATEEADRK